MDCVYCVVLVLVILFLIRWLLGLLKVRHLNEKYVFVSGCDSGFGRIAVRKFSQMGVNVFAGCLTEAAVKELNSIPTTHGKIIALQLNVTSEESINRAGLFVRTKLPNDKALWAVVNNAGIVGSLGPSHLLKRKHYEEVLNVNLHGMVDLTREFLDLLQKSKGRIVNTASVAGRLAIGGTSPYTVSKFAVEAFSDCIRRELYHFRVSVHTIEPGFFQTAITDPKLTRLRVVENYEKSAPHLKEIYDKEFIEESVNVAADITNKMASSRTYLVADAYVHAATSMFPKTRYRVGIDSRTIFRIMENMPDFIPDFLFGLKAPKPKCVK